MKKINSFSILIFLFFAIALGGCGTNYNVQTTFPDGDGNSLISDEISKSLIIFFDGTRNDWESRTNVRRLYEFMALSASPSLRTLYVEGVGNTDSQILGSALGFRMKPRILSGLQFLTENYEMGDQIYLFGFSRGALQARALAGMISYCGIPLIKGSESPRNLAYEFWDICRGIEEIEREQWTAFESQVLPIDFLGKRVNGLESQWAPIQFVGVWDTVPGSSFIDYDACIERPNRKEGTRYKTGSYPNIKFIAHAVAIDEERTRYEPLLLCEPVDENETIIREAWFSGAHSDVGGGYNDSIALPGLSMNWMINLLEQHSSLPLAFPNVYENVGGLAHSSSWYWKALDEFDVRNVPTDACRHPSVDQRSKLTEVPVMRSSKIEQEKYEPTVLIERECEY